MSNKVGVLNEDIIEAIDEKPINENFESKFMVENEKPESKEKVESKVMYESENPSDKIEKEGDKSNEKTEESAEGGETFGNALEFFFSTLGYAVGVGNVWRFPYLAYKNGGGVFLIPYFIFMLLIGIPMVFLEFYVGQFTSNGPLTAWKQLRISKGVGISMNIANTLYVIYYNLIIAYSLYFLVLSFNTELPWQTCKKEWSSPNCVDDYSKDKFAFNECLNTTYQFKCDTDKTHINYGKCFNLTTANSFGEIGFNASTLTCSNFSGNDTIEYWKPQFPSQDFWQKVILNQSGGIEESGSMQWQLVVALFATYFIVYLMVVKGVAIYGKLVYFITTFPYIVLLALGIRGWTLPGAAKGVEFYVVPDFDRLGDINVWRDAATQIFFTLAISYGGMLTFASYNKFNTNIRRDAILIPFANCITSFFAGFVIFAYMGYLAEITGQDIKNVVTAGQGLAFVVYPYAVTTIPAAPVWSCLFFLMMALLGLDSTLGSVEVTIKSVIDYYPSLGKKRVITVTVIFLFYFLCGLLFCIQSGTYWLELFNSYAGDWSILFTAAFECITMAWFYGFNNLKNDIRCMLGDSVVDSKSWLVFCVLWGFVCPVLMITIIIITWTQLKVITLGEYVYPGWTLGLGQFMTTSVTFGVIGWVIYALYDAKKNNKSFRSLIRPQLDDYVPTLEKNRDAVQIIRGRFQKSRTGDVHSYNLENLAYKNDEQTETYL